MTDSHKAIAHLEQFSADVIADLDGELQELQRKSLADKFDRSLSKHLHK